MRDLRCPHCDYALAGHLGPAAHAHRALLHCPECGGITDLDELTRLAVSRRRRGRRAARDAALFLAIGGVLFAAVAASGASGIIGIANVTGTLRAIFESPLGLRLAVMPPLLAILYFGTRRLWLILLPLERVLFTGAALILLLLVQMPTAAGLTALWLLALHLRAEPRMHAAPPDAPAVDETG